MPKNQIKKNLIALWIVLVVLLIQNTLYAIQPSGPDSYENKSTESPLPTIGALINTSGGTITTINFQATTQNPRWKGFVGNITGRFALMDANNFSLYDWTLTTVQGEIYATRNSSLVDWISVRCANSTTISSEQNSLGFLSTDADTINKTFNQTTHNSFYAGDTFIRNNTCPSTYLYVSGQSQNNTFQELLLYEDNIIYTSLIEGAEIGYSNQTYDYQIIVPDNTQQGQPSEVYYLYIELI